MKLKTLNAVLKQLARAGRWCVPEAAIRAHFPAESDNTFFSAMSRHVRSGAVERLSPGLYLNPYAPAPAAAAEQLVGYLRPDDFCYLSLESALHEYGRISQVPSVTTFMTTGSSKVFHMPISGGSLEFVHTKRPIEAWRSRTHFDPARRIYIASEELALEDLRHVGRNLDLVEKDEE